MNRVENEKKDFVRFSIPVAVIQVFTRTANAHSVDRPLIGYPDPYRRFDFCKTGIARGRM